MDDLREEKEPKGGKFRHFLGRFAVLLLTLLVVLGAVAVSLLGEGKYLNRIRGWLAYGSGDSENLYSFAADPYNRYGQIGEYLVVLNQNHFQILESDGTALFAQEVQLSQPALSVGGDMAAAYDVGGENLYVFSRDGLLLQREAGEGIMISARLNNSGYLAVVAEEDGYKGVVTVYDADMNRVFAYRSSSQFLSDALVSEDCTSVTAVALGQQEGSFCTQLIRYELDQTQPEGETALVGHLTLDAEMTENRFISVSDNEITFTDLDGLVTGSFTYGGLYLHDYTLSGGDFAAVLLNRYRSGSIATLVSVDGAGKAIAMLDITEEVMDISAAGEYLAVLYNDSLVIYNRALEQQSVVEDTGYASRILMNADGTVLVIGGNTAWRYLP